MSAFIIRTEYERTDAIKVLQEANLPCTFRLDRGADRSIEQNRLMWGWYGDIWEQLKEQTPGELHRECKLTIGVPIILADPTKAQESFCDAWANLIEPQSYEAQLDLVEHMPVTSMMTTRQMTTYLNELHRRYTIERGVRLDA